MSTVSCKHSAWLSIGLAAAALAAGCQSPYYADRGALAGGLTGAGLGAIVGNAVGSTTAGAAIGAGVGTATGAAIGGALDDIEARNRAQIAAQLGRPVATGAATIGEVVAMAHAGVDSRLMINYVNTSGVAQPVGAQDVIYLSQQGVPTEVIDAMQTPRMAARPVAYVPPPAPVIVEEHVYGPPYWRAPRRHYHYGHFHRPSPRVGWGISISN